MPILTTNADSPPPSLFAYNVLCFPFFLSLYTHYPVCIPSMQVPHMVWARDELQQPPGRETGWSSRSYTGYVPFFLPATCANINNATTAALVRCIALVRCLDYTLHDVQSCFRSELTAVNLAAHDNASSASPALACAASVSTEVQSTARVPSRFKRRCEKCSKWKEFKCFPGDEPVCKQCCPGGYTLNVLGGKQIKAAVYVDCSGLPAPTHSEGTLPRVRKDMVTPRQIVATKTFCNLSGDRCFYAQIWPKDYYIRGGTGAQAGQCWMAPLVFAAGNPNVTSRAFREVATNLSYVYLMQLATLPFLERKDETELGESREITVSLRCARRLTMQCLFKLTHRADSVSADNMSI